MTKYEIAQKIDHTNLKSDTSLKDIKKLCEEAKTYNFYSVCVHPTYVKRAKKFLANSEVKVITVVGFPLGATLTEIKSLEAMLCVQNGAQEIDMVLNISALKENDLDYVYNEIMQVVSDAKVPVKVILETSKLTKEEIITACNLCVRAGAKYVKTSTGFDGGATIEAVSLMKEVVGKDAKVKASGGIRDLSTALSMLSNGADRLGTSSGVNIIKDIV